ncbi:MAG: hypothetical protein V3R85_10155, partial [Alphaproteobacteria bacterium]
MPHRFGDKTKYDVRRDIYNRVRVIAALFAALIVFINVPAGAAGPVRILVLGDSLAAGYGL